MTSAANFSLFGRIDDRQPPAGRLTSWLVVLMWTVGLQYGRRYKQSHHTSQRVPIRPRLVWPRVRGLCWLNESVLMSLNLGTEARQTEIWFQLLPRVPLCFNEPWSCRDASVSAPRSPLSWTLLPSMEHLDPTTGNFRVQPNNKEEVHEEQEAVWVTDSFKIKISAAC